MAGVLTKANRMMDKTWKQAGSKSGWKYYISMDRLQYVPTRNFLADIMDIASGCATDLTRAHL